MCNASSSVYHGGKVCDGRSVRTWPAILLKREKEIKLINDNVTVKTFIRNLPVSFGAYSSGFMVARLDGIDLWYYGIYNDKERAENVAREIGNGVVFEL